MNQEFLVVCATKDELIKRTQGKAVDELFVFAFHWTSTALFVGQAVHDRLDRPKRTRIRPQRKR